jgi:hypothetical protein
MEPSVGRARRCDVKDIQFGSGRFGSKCSAPIPLRTPRPPRSVTAAIAGARVGQVDVNRPLSSPRVGGLIALGIGTLFSLLVAGGRPMPASATTAQIAFSPSSSTVAVGGNVNVDITVADVSNLGGYDVFLQFNPAVVHLTSLVDSGFVRTNPTNIVVCNNSNQGTIDNSAGTATESCATVVIFPPPGPGVSTVAATALMHASFTAVGAGTSSLTLTGTTLQDPLGNAIAAALGTGSITVTAAQSVGGIAEEPDVAALPSRNSPPHHAGAAYALAGAALVAAATALAGLAWWGVGRMRAPTR